MSPDAGSSTGPITRVLLFVVRGYQLVVSPWIAPRCRFYPSCSSYAVTALRRHGAVRGSGLTARRLARCHPWNPGGVDHVPAPRRSVPASAAASPTAPSAAVTPADDQPADGPPAAA